MIFDHFNVSAPAEVLVRERDFFCELFQLTVGDRPDFRRPGYWLYYQENALIHLTQSDEHFPANKPVYLDHIAFRLNDLEATIERLEKMSANYVKKGVPSLNLVQIFLRSPAGVGVEINFIE